MKIIFIDAWIESFWPFDGESWVQSSLWSALYPNGITESWFQIFKDLHNKNLMKKLVMFFTSKWTWLSSTAASNWCSCNSSNRSMLPVFCRTAEAIVPGTLFSLGKALPETLRSLWRTFSASMQTFTTLSEGLVNFPLSNISFFSWGTRQEDYVRIRTEASEVFPPKVPSLVTYIE